MMLQHEEAEQLLNALSLKISLPRWQAKGLKSYAELLKRPLRLGIFGESGSGQPSLINVLLQRQIFTQPRSYKTRPITLMRYGDVLSSYSVKNNGARYRLTSKVLTRSADRKSQDNDKPSKVIYQSRKGALSVRSYGMSAARYLSPQTHLDPNFIEMLIPYPLLKSMEIIEVPVTSALSDFGDYTNSYIQNIDIAIWVTIATGAWKNSEYQAWKKLAVASPERSILVVTDNESLDQNEAIKLKARLDTDTVMSFGSRIYVTLQDEEHALNSSPQQDDPNFTQIGLQELHDELHRIKEAISVQRLERIKRSLKKFNMLSEDFLNPQLSNYSNETHMINVAARNAQQNKA